MDQAPRDKYFRMVIIISVIFAAFLVGLFVWSYLLMQENFLSKERFQRLDDRVGNLESKFEEQMINIDTRLEVIEGRTE